MTGHREGSGGEAFGLAQRGRDARHEVRSFRSLVDLERVWRAVRPVADDQAFLDVLAADAASKAERGCLASKFSVRPPLTKRATVERTGRPWKNVLSRMCGRCMP